MSDHILILNAGSSSLKFCVYQPPHLGRLEMVLRGQIEGIGVNPTLSARNNEGHKLEDKRPLAEINDAQSALDELAKWLRSYFSDATVVGVGHRVVHGGTSYLRPTIVTNTVLSDLRTLVPLAPLHQPYNLAAIEAVSKRLPGVPQVACFDTGFHQTNSPVAQLVPLPENIRSKGVQRYGFHGLSYEYISSIIPEVAPEIQNGRVIVAHLGSGASMCAMLNCRSVDTTMSFTALDGLCMGTRPGALDAGIVLYLFQTLGLSVTDVENILYKKSGLLGISGISNDMRILLDDDRDEALQAIEYFVYRAAKEIGALAAVLKGVDAIVFTAGIGENSPAVRQKICDASSWLGLELDHKANQGNEFRISTRGSKVGVYIIPTNEELMIANHLSKELVL